MKERLKEMFTAKSFRAGGYSAFAGIILTAIVVVAVIMTDSVPARFTKLDMTSNKLFSLSEESKSLAKSLKNDVNIYLIAQSGAEDSLLKNTLEQYEGMTDKIKVKVKDPVLEPNFVTKYTSEQVQLNSVIVECGTKSRYVAYGDLYEQQYSQDYSTQSVSFKGEGSITNAIRAVSETEITKLYIVSGHGESELDTSMAEAVKQNNIETEEISLVTADKIPEDASAILIYEPQSDISADEKTMLDEYVTGGGSILLYTGYTGRSFSNLNALMQSYGVEAENGLVVEGDSGRALRGYKHYVVPGYGSHAITEPLSENGYFVLSPVSQAIKETEEDKGTEVTKLLTTSSKAYIKMGVSDGATLEKTADDKTGSYTLGVAVTKETDGKTGRIVWYSGQIMLSSQISQMVSGGNQDLFLNSVNWMCDRAENITIHAKNLDTEFLNVSTGAGRLWSIIFIFVIPAAVIALGVYVWMRRRRR